MSNLWFSSDHHFYHKNILKLQRHTRKGETIDEHHELLIDAHNSLVKPEDKVMFLGDLSFGGTAKTAKILDRLNGEKFMILGNHDNWDQGVLKQYFTGISNYYQLKHDNKHVILCHFPIAVFDRMHHGSYHLHGHTHGAYSTEGRTLDVGIDNRPTKDMLPWHWDEIVQYMEARPVVNRVYTEIL